MEKDMAFWSSLIIMSIWNAHDNKKMTILWLILTIVFFVNRIVK